MNPQPEEVNADVAWRLDDLKTDLQTRLNGRVWDLHLTWRDGGLILQGQAGTFYAKQLAQETVMQTTRLPVLANDIAVV